MRVVCALLASIVASSATAYAHPVRDPFDDVFERRVLRGKGGRPKPVHIPTPEETCDRNVSWTKLVKCLGKGATVKTLYDLPKARVVSVSANPAYDSAAVFLYTQKNGRWERSGYFASNSSNEILSFVRLKSENGYRMEQGSVFKTATMVGDRFPGGEQQRVPVTLRRMTTTVCLDNGYCQSLITSCDALVDGKTRWSFHGTATIDHGQVRVTGDRTFAAQICAPSTSQFSDIGDVLE